MRGLLFSLPLTHVSLQTCADISLSSSHLDIDPIKTTVGVRVSESVKCFEYIVLFLVRMFVFLYIAKYNGKMFPFSFSHLIQTSGIALLYLLSFLINQLYCNTFRRVLVVLHCALEHASSHFSIGIASCRSSLHASSCPADVSVLPSTWHLYILDIKPLPKQFILINFSMVDISGIHNV